MRGYFLEQDLNLIFNNPKYSDIEIVCEDEKKLYGCRAILAARSEVFDRLLYNGMKESYENRISFPRISSTVMKIILEYIYVGTIKEESLTEDNIVETLIASDYLQLPNLQDFIIKIIKDNFEKNYKENYSPELLSRIMETLPIVEKDDVFVNLLIEAVSTIPLNTIKFDRLSVEALQYLLSCTYNQQTYFATSEYEVFRYGAVLAAKQVSNNAYKSLLERLPTLEQINSVQAKDKFITDHQKVAKELEPLINVIDFRRIKPQILVDVIEPLGIIPPEIIKNVCQNKRITDLNENRGPSYVWDKSACGSELVIEDNGKVVYAPTNIYQNVRAKMSFENEDIFEWNVIIENTCKYAWIGVCAPEDFSYETFAGYQPTGWILGSHGYCFNSRNVISYCPPFEDGIVTVHLDMKKRTCAFTVNGTRYPEVPEWNDLPSKLHPVVSMRHPGRFRIQPKRF